MNPTPPLDHLFHSSQSGRYAQAMHLGVSELSAALARTVGRPATGRAPEQASKPIADVDLDNPLGDIPAALAEMRALYLDDAVWFHEPAYAAHLNCPVVIPALLAELFVSGVNSSLDTFDQSVGGTYIERHLIEWTAGRIGFGTGADGVFTSGGTQSNLQALLLARDHTHLAWPGTPSAALRIFASTDAHFSVQKSARLLGLGEEAVVAVPVDEHRRLDAVALARALATSAERGEVPMAIVATAGTTDFGAIDPLADIAVLARAYDTWMHVDAAYGGGLLASSTRRDRLSGIEHARSVTIDFHKTWFQPVSASALVVADGRDLGHVTWHADYLNPRDAFDTDSPNQVDKSLQTTRRFDALKLWLTLRIMGPEQIGTYVDTIVDLANATGSTIAARSDVELAAVPQLSTVVFRFRPPAMSEDAADDLVPRIRAALYERGLAMVAATRVDGRRWLKLTLLNPAATPADIERIVDLVVELGRELGTEAVA
ncbi:aspartate aminotransferase family protein [Nocardioides sp. R-C-SC26]|uniref:pyridoxal phosphate-dependent decarboxylase family protein n=1 Tax=Nocardioides sp. R-C-SC26 TaxID=2870414 RepID=UPI001E5DB8B3|nr:aspartate aminotransferase family protein [Nocardioides sp. R-C-SC26]